MSVFSSTSKITVRLFELEPTTSYWMYASTLSPSDKRTPAPRVAVTNLPSAEIVVGYVVPPTTTWMFARSLFVEAEPVWLKVNVFNRMSSAEPAVRRKPDTRYAVVPISFVIGVFAANELETSSESTPMTSVKLTVWKAPVIGREPETAAEVL